MTDSVPDLTCKELVELVTEYLEDALAPEERTRFELHLTYCEWCRTYLQQMREVLATAGRIEEESLPPEDREALLAAFRGWKRRTDGGSA